MHVPRGPIRAAVLLASVASLLVTAPAAANEVLYVTELTGDAEVPGPGDPDGSGSARLSISPADGELCWEIEVDGVAPATAAHVHAGGSGVSGDAVVSLGTPDGDGSTEDCSSGHDPAVLQGIVDDPWAFYVNVHDADFPDGALRGQLAPLELTRVTVFEYACPADTDREADLDTLAATCAPVARPDGIPNLPDGYSWAVEPIATDLEIHVVPQDGDVLDLADAAPAVGDATCDPETLTCTRGIGYAWDAVIAGQTDVRQVAWPDGYRPAWVIVQSDTIGGTVPDVSESDAGDVTMDTLAITDGVVVVFVDLADPGPAPTPDATAGATDRPAVTPPPTSTGTPPGGTAAGLVWALLAGITVGAGLLLMPRTRRD